uniref:Transmembrane protein n=1 Tax=Lactuca sativa TaxID=4236 RepID=A0A9R1UCC6_LACSA|nr:hypothetical protein LSAT_V11C900463280 [Lactuca sativa]
MSEDNMVVEDVIKGHEDAFNNSPLLVPPILIHLEIFGVFACVNEGKGEKKKHLGIIIFINSHLFWTIVSIKTHALLHFMARSRLWSGFLMFWLD